MSAGRILVVDDDPQIRRVMRVTLTGQGYEVDDAKSGDAALEKLREERFDLVLLDMNMPGLDGLETCRLIVHANRVLSHRELFQGVWGPDYGNELDTLRVLVNQLRKKIEAQPSKPVFLLTEPWVGYRFSLSPHAAPTNTKADDTTVQRR